MRKKFPENGKALGKSVRGFWKARVA
ncbi:twin-arginine translocase TatA/TatE family subunit [Leptospira wolffii]|uniref:Twin-arginine translocase TatA/TatE family subunit n=1 Tax=Leptospira wolffii TaxID=409998 RepID=A0ABV5BPL1_9LEPT